MKTTTIFIRSYAKDFPWLHYAIRSIKKYATGFSEVVVAVPFADMAQAQPICAPFRVIGVADDPSKGYLDQQVTKMLADLWVQSELVTYMDSDCVFIQPTTPESLLTADGRIRYLITPWSEVAEAIMWKEPTEKVLGWETQYEAMRRHPMTFPTSVVQQCRCYIEAKHGLKLRQYILAQPRFSEFNVLGNFALRQAPQHFVFIDTTKEELPPLVMRQFWSHGGMAGDTHEFLEATVA